MYGLVYSRCKKYGFCQSCSNVHEMDLAVDGAYTSTCMIAILHRSFQ